VRLARHDGVLSRRDQRMEITGGERARRDELGLGVSPSKGLVGDAVQPDDTRGEMRGAKLGRKPRVVRELGEPWANRSARRRTRSTARHRQADVPDEYSDGSGVEDVVVLHSPDSCTVQTVRFGDSPGELEPHEQRGHLAGFELERLR